MSPVADVQVVTHAEVLVVRVSGEIDTMNASWVGSQIAAACSGAGGAVIVDLSETTYVDSRGVQVFFDLAEQLKTRRQAMGIVLPLAQPLRRVLRLNRLDAVVRFAETVEQARRTLLPGSGEARNEGPVRHP